MFTSTVITLQVAGLDDNPKLPYLVLYFSLSYKRGEIKNLNREFKVTSKRNPNIKLS